MCTRSVLRVFFFRVYLSLSSLSLFTKIFLFKPQKSKTFLHHDEETVRERDKSVSDAMRMYAEKLGKTPQKNETFSLARAKGSDRHADRDERVFWKSHNAVQNNFTQ